MNVTLRISARGKVCVMPSETSTTIASGEFETSTPLYVPRAVTISMSGVKIRRRRMRCWPVFWFCTVGCRTASA